MDDAAVHAIDGIFAANPMWGLVIGILVIASVVAIKLVPFFKELASEKASNEADLAKKKLDNEHQLELERIDIEKRREERKHEELQFRKEREIENASISRQFVDATNRSTTAISALIQTMEVQSAEIKMSRQGSQRMSEQVQDIHMKVYDIDSAIEDIKTEIL